MAYSYDLKVVVSGKQVEVYKYKRNIWKEYKSKKENIKEPKQSDMFVQANNKKLRAKSSINRTRTEIRRLINSNFELNKFLTLTFAENITDLKTANNIFNKFIKRLAYQYPDLKYVAVFEFQKRGAVHYHLLCNLPYVDSKELASIWNYRWHVGFIKIKRTNDVNNLGAYMSKYLGKEIDERTFRKKKFFRSQNLKEPIELVLYKASKFIEKYLSNSVPTYEKIFNSEWTGEIKYSAYTLDSYPDELISEIDRIKTLMIE
jgi:hypothetical protein